MLDNEAYVNIAQIKAIAIHVWGENCVFGELEVLDRPFSEFCWPMRLYNAFDVLLEYERSSVGFKVNTQQGFIGWHLLTNEQVIRGLKSCKPENMLHNFQVLDRVLRGSAD